MSETKRQVQLTGGSSFAVTLPKSWAKRQGIREGSSLIMRITDDGGLLIYPEERQPQKTFTEIRLELGPNVGRDIVGAYLYGYNTIKIHSYTSFEEDELVTIKRVVRGLVGAEIVEEAPNKIEIQVMLDPEAVTPEKVLRRQNSLVLGMVDDVAKALMNNDVSLAKAVAQRDEEVDRHYFTLVRVIRSAIRDPEIGRRMRQTPLSLLDLRVAAKFLEDSGDQAATIAREILGQKEGRPANSLVEEFCSLASIVIEMGPEPIEALLTGDAALTLHALSLRRKFQERSSQFRRMLSQAPLQAQLFLIHSYACLDRICENMADIAELGAPIAGRSTN